MARNIGAALSPRWRVIVATVTRIRISPGHRANSPQFRWITVLVNVPSFT